MALFSYLKERMMEHPDATVGDGQECIRYDTLLERAEALGKTLTQDKYGLLCKSELHTATALMACLSAGKTAAAACSSTMAPAWLSAKPPQVFLGS